ncbi:MAG: hypothetical protein J6J35_01895 [Alphaproteobacteria bacterium]|nr:hypothetical protein [Alphaproteobacteria bacterium]
MILGYLDSNKKNIDVESQRQQILSYTSETGSEVDMFVQESEIKALRLSLKTNDHTVIFANIVALGASLFQIKESLLILAQLNLTVVLVKEGYVWRSKNLAEILSGLELAIDIRNSLSSIVTKKALADKKASGFSLGRKSRNKKRRLDDKSDEIIMRKLRGESNLEIARALGVAPTTLYGFYRQHPELKTRFAGGENA